MNSVEVITNWKIEHNFVANVSGHDIVMSTNHEVGSSPKQLLLAGLAGCTGIDVVDMLKKMRVHFSSFCIVIHANQTTEHPKIYDLIKLEYRFKGQDLDLEKIKKAVKLSKEKYCGVSAMLGKSSKIEYEIFIDL